MSQVHMDGGTVIYTPRDRPAVSRTLPVGVPLVQRMEQPVPMWRDSTYHVRTHTPVKDTLVRMVQPGETLWAVDGTIVGREPNDTVLILSEGGAGWMAPEHLDLRR